MRFAAYFEAAARLSGSDPAQAERLIREAEAHSLASVPEHLNHCARLWMEYLHDRDNAMRCLLLNECRTAQNDQAALLEITEAYLVIVHDFASAERCFKKALAAATPVDGERFREFMAKYGRPNLGLVERRLRPKSAVRHTDAWQVDKTEINTSNHMPEGEKSENGDTLCLESSNL